MQGWVLGCEEEWGEFGGRQWGDSAGYQSGETPEGLRAVGVE